MAVGALQSVLARLRGDRWTGRIQELRGVCKLTTAGTTPRLVWMIRCRKAADEDAEGKDREDSLGQRGRYAATSSLRPPLEEASSYRGSKKKSAFAVLISFFLFFMTHKNSFPAKGFPSQPQIARIAFHNLGQNKERDDVTVKITRREMISRAASFRNSGKGFSK